MELKNKFFTEHLNSLTPEEWVDLLTANHSFWEYCACREKFNSRDWRKLVQFDYEFFADKCEWQKLDVEDWFLLLINKNIYQRLLLHRNCSNSFPQMSLTVINGIN